MIEEERSSSKSASREVKCAICGKVLKDKRAIGSHMRKHKKPQAAVNPPPLPQTPQLQAPQLLQNPLPPQPLQPQPQQPQASFDPASLAPVLSFLASIFGERKDVIREKVDKAFGEWLDTILSLPSILLKGYGKGLEDAIKGYVRETVKEELRDIRETIEKVLRREEKREERGGEEAHT